jgi:hypothetical protein
LELIADLSFPDLLGQQAVAQLSQQLVGSLTRLAIAQQVVSPISQTRLGNVALISVDEMELS